MIAQGSIEAQNNLKFLSELQGPCEKLSQAAPADIPSILPEILNLIRMIWTVSKFYNTDERVTQLLRKISNQIIVQCGKKIDLDQIFDGDVQLSMVHLRESIACGDAWHDIYAQATRAIAADTSFPGKWEFDPSTHGIFAQIDAFKQRCHNLMEVCEGQLQFARKTKVLAKGERAELPAFGGSRGSEIQKSLYEIEEEFEKHIDRLRNLDYDILDVKATFWHYDYGIFKNGLNELEVMLTNVISSAWEGVSTVATGVELLESFYHLAIREGMKQNVERKTAEVYQLFQSEVKKVKNDFDKHKKHPPLPNGQPRFAGAALWAKSLLTRIDADMKHLESAVLPSLPDAEAEAENAYQQLANVLKGYMTLNYDQWNNAITQATTESTSLANRLDRTLMIKAAEAAQAGGGKPGARTKSSGYLESNFDKQLLRLFNEVRYWEKFNGEFSIKYTAHEMKLRQDSLRVLFENVMLVVRDYNNILDALSPEERRLFSEHLRQVDRKIGPGLVQLTWGEKHIKEWFVRVCRGKCYEVFQVVTAFKANNDRIQQNCEKIANCMLVDIEKNVVYDDVVFEQKQIRHQDRVKAELEACHFDIIETMKNSYTFFAEHASCQNHWLKFVRKIDQMVEDALRTTVQRSLQELSKAINGDAKMGSKREPHPLFKVNMVLDEIKGKVEFRPTMAGLGEMIKHMSKTSMTTIQVVPRLSEVLTSDTLEQPGVQFEGKEGEDAKKAMEVAAMARIAAAAKSGKQRCFYDIICEDDGILKIMATIFQGTTHVAGDLGKIISHYDRYQALWNTDKHAFIRRYANSKRPLANFDLEIGRYKNQQADIQAEDQSHNVSFIRIDCSLLKASLVSHCQQWQTKLTGLLHHNATTELMELHKLIDDTSEALVKVPDSLDALAESIKLLEKTVADKTVVEGKFEPTEDMYKCLDKFDVHISDEEKEKLDNLRVKWTEFAQVQLEAELMLEGKKSDMSKELEDTLVSFGTQVQDTRAEFLDTAPFSAPAPGEGEPDIASAEVFIASYRKKIADNRAKAESMKKGMDLFGIPHPEYKDTDDTEKELNQLEGVWIQMKSWLGNWDAWKSGKFTDLNVKDLEKTAAEYQKDMNKNPRSVKNWKVWKSLAAIIQKFRTTLPLISDLRSEAMRDRHWQQLQEEIQQTFDPYGEDFTLDKINSLGLTSHAPAIATLANVAARELSIENNLKEIAGIWKVQLVDIVPYKGKYFKLRSVEEVNDNLEAHQLSLATMKNSPYFLTFADDINYWIRTLNDLSETVECITQVQRTWMYLESIFMDSADIRKQLPAESSLFETVNNSWIENMEKLNVDKKALDLLREGLLESLQRADETLEKINRSLDQYLEKKRQLFPRFYFLSNEDLLEILGQSRDPGQVNKHIRKFFAGIKVLELMAPKVSGNKYFEVTGMVSPDGEEVKMLDNVSVEGDVEAWLTNVEIAMRDTLQRLLRDALAHVQKASQKKANLENWVKSTIGQLLITSGQIGWTAKCTSALSDTLKNKRAMRKLKSEWHDYLGKLAKYVRNDISTAERNKLVALITIEVHARDVIDKLKISARNKINVNSFEWTSQLRFYFERTLGDYGKAIVKQTNTQFDFGYEYQGNNGRLAVTPLTDRCYMTLTTALSLCRGGCPQGPAGTGKTETVKDLGKGLAMFVVVFNCSPVMDVNSCARNFSGLVQTGAWGCFDEFNRIVVEVLSVVALQVTCILDALKAKASMFMFEGFNIKLVPTVGIFITMNPVGAGYTGRSRLPDNLSCLFRPVAMMTPDLQLIAEIMLQSEGFNSAQPLSKKITTIYNLMTQQLSKQSHYDYGLRAIKAVLARAGQLNRAKSADMSEETVLMQALKDMNHSKMIAEDTPLFDNLLSDLFPNLELPAMDYGQLKVEIINQLEVSGHQPDPYLVHKIIQIVENMATRHGNMIVGLPFSGKSVAWQTLQKALTALHARGEKYQAVDTYIMNPKAVETDELYGFYDPISKEWTDGVLATLMREACSSETPSDKWLILDGPVDTVWIESMNTVLDDNKVLTLVNGDRIAMPPNVALLFEVQDLAVASPATVSRAGMIYLDQGRLGWMPLYQSWVDSKKKLWDEFKNPKQGEDLPPEPALNEIGCNLLGELVNKYLEVIFAWRRSDPDVVELIPIVEANAVQSFTRLFDALGTSSNIGDKANEADYLKSVEMWYAFCIIWSVGAALTGASRLKFDVKMRDIEAIYPPLNTVFDFFIDPSKRDWTMWEDKVNANWRPAAGTPFFSLFVPTVDTVRHSYLLTTLLKNRNPTLVVGTTGTGKTSGIENILGKLDDSYLPFTMNFSSATSSIGVQEQLESRLEKRNRNNFGPLGNRDCMACFIDDLNMPKMNEYFSQPPIELLRQFMEYGFWYDRAKQTKKNILDVLLFAAMSPPGGARSKISERFQSRFNLINFPFPADKNVLHIYRSLLVNHMQEFDESVKPLAPTITQATLDVYKEVVKGFLPTPSCCHYLFNMRDISRVFQGMLQSTAKYYDTREAILRLWIHESLRVFSDRLINDKDREKFSDMINSKLSSMFETSWKKLFKDGVDQPLFGDFLEDDSAAALNDDDDGTIPYQELTLKYPQVKAFITEKHNLFCLDPDNVPVDLVLFDMAISHVARIYRIINQPRGCAMLVGVGGSGRRSCTRLATYMAGMKSRMVEVSKSYRMQDWREDVKDLYKTAGVEQEPTVFIFDDTQIVNEAMLEDINNMLNSGEIPKLFPDDELTPILEDLRPEAEKVGHPTTSDGLYAFLIERTRSNLHIVLGMSPVGSTFRDYVRMFPALVNCTTIDWFNKWPQEALMDVAERFLSAVDFGTDTKVRESLANVFCQFHVSAEKMSDLMESQLKRFNYITPTKYLDLVKAYASILKAKRNEITAKADKLRNGLDKLVESKVQVEEMSVELEDKKKVVAQKKIQCEKLSVEIIAKKRNADEQKNIVEVDAAKAKIEAAECDEIKAVAMAELEKVTPALEKAVSALDKLSKNAVVEVKSYAKPPELVQTTMEAVMVILEKPLSWASAKKELGDPQFLQRLKEFDKDKISNSVLKKIGSYTKRKNFNADEIGKVSQAAGALCEWVCAMELYAKVFRDVEPRRIALAKAEAKLEKKKNELAEKAQMLAEVIAKVTALEEDYNKSEADQQKYTNDAKMLEAKLLRAQELVEGLGSERERWGKAIEGFEIDYKHLVGDCSTAAAFLSYAGPFLSNYREDFKKGWILSVKKAGLSCSTKFDFVTFLAAPTDIMDWNIQGLPSDLFSVENGVAALRGIRWPLMIDPQGQANLWVKAMEAKNLKTIDFRTPHFIRAVESSVQYGTPILIQDVAEDLDPSLDPVLRVSPLDAVKPKTLIFGDKEVTYSDSFFLYMTSNMANPHYLPQVSTKTTVINFCVKDQGLQDQCLAVVVKFEEPALETEKANLVKSVAAGQRKLAELEDEILSLLKNTSGNLLDDENLVATLKSSKITSKEVHEKLAVSKETEVKIDEAREAYRAIAVRASMCYFVLNDLALVDPMYQFSLKSYLDLFKLSIKDSKDEKADSEMDISARIVQLNDYHTEAVYNYTCRALFEKHKLIFAFKLCTEKMKSENALNFEEYDFFLRGGQVLDRSQRPANPCNEWLSEVAWDNISELDKIESFTGLAQSFEQNGAEWRQWFRSDDPPPEKLQPPGEFSTKRDEFQQMLILRCLRPDRVVYAARSFITNNLGPQYIESPAFDLNAIYNTSTFSSPLIFVLSPGVDPMVILRTLADKLEVKLDFIALGQGQTPIAMRLLKAAMKAGTWVFLANCHLCLSWLPELAQLVENLALTKGKDAPHENFRLWLSSDPHPKFPISLLQASVKMTTEPPKGLKANMHRLYAALSDEQFEKCKTSEKYKKLLFSLVYFHSALIERKKFLSLGWNIMYEFNDSDFDVCENILSIYLDEYEETPWDAMKYLIAQANYGGRVTDAQDVKVLIVYSNQFFCDAALNNPKYHLSSSPHYYIPEDGANRQHYMKYISTLPNSDADPPEAFGQHPNADIASQMEDTKTLLSTVLSLQPRASGGGGGKSTEEVVLDLIAQLAEQVPEPYNAKELRSKFEHQASDPLTVVLLQECDRYNVLLQTIHSSLNDLAKGIKGIVVISAALEAMFNSLVDAQVPAMWSFAYPSLKALGPWTRDLIARCAQLSAWIEGGPPKVYWLSGFTFPTGYLTALLQNSARKNQVSIDTLGWDFVVMTSNEQSLGVAPKEGAYVKGLFLEGARWDNDNGVLCEPLPMELYCTMPIIHFKPVEAKRKASKGLHPTPCYMYPVRTGSRERPSFMLEVDLKSGARDSNFWTKRGTALLMSLAD